MTVGAPDMIQQAGDRTAIDGRRARSRSSHRRIMTAMMDLMAGGDLSPSAARVAEAAGIGLRTVFRHFDDMDAIYAEIAATVMDRVKPVIVAPYTDPDWRTNLRELVRRRTGIFETTLPFRLAANLKRYQSPFLMGQYHKVVTLERELVMNLLPDHVRADKMGIEALCAALSFHNWRVLRHDQGLAAEAAAVVMARLVDALIATLPLTERAP